jgi:Ni,Fe-hydrogenase III small subunit
MLNILKNSFSKGLLTQKFTVSPDAVGHALPQLGKQLRAVIYASYGRSLHIREVDTGSCGACESEISALNNPIYDIQRFGIDFVASPRHADALLVTGPVSKNMVVALQRTFNSMPEPKFVITLGDCTLKGGLFGDSYYIAGSIEKILGVTVVHIPGCPPDPEKIMTNLLSYLVRKTGSHVEV